MIVRRRTANQRSWDKATRAGMYLYTRGLEHLYSDITDIGNEGRTKEKSIVEKG